VSVFLVWSCSKLESTSNSKSVLIGIPHKDRSVNAKCYAFFLSGLFANIFTAARAGIPIGLHQGFGPRLDVVRNSIVQYFLEQTKATHLFFLDDDVLVMPDTILRLLKRKAPIVSGLYYERAKWHRPIIIDTPKGRGGKFRFQFRYRGRPPRNKLLQCDVVPAGCLMIERSVFRTLQHPWFNTDRKQSLGEDVYFSLCARRAGLKILVDTGVDSLHIVTHVIGSDDAIEKWKQEFGFAIEI
jgi:GT2 family glycosyltransferase